MFASPKSIYIMGHIGLMVIVMDNVNDVSSDLLVAIARAVHRIVGNMPVTIKSNSGTGVLVDRERIVVGGLESSLLEGLLGKPVVTKLRIDDGIHTGKEMYVSPIVQECGDASHIIGVIGVIDTSGTLALKEMAEHHTSIISQVKEV